MPTSAVAAASSTTSHASSGIDPSARAEQAVRAFLGREHNTSPLTEIEALQRALNTLGANPALGVDGLYGDNTEDAVTDFLEEDRPSLAYGAGINDTSKRAPVKQLQRALNVLTNAGMPVDGKLGRGTEAALALWQRSLGADNPSPEGQVNRATWNALLVALVAKLDPGSSATNPPPTTVPPPTGPGGGLPPPTGGGVSTPGSTPTAPTGPLAGLNAADRARYLTRVDQRAANILNLGTKTVVAEDGDRGPRTRAVIADLGRGTPTAIGVQAALDTLGYEMDVDGIFGSGSRAGLAEFRRDHNLDSTSANPTAADQKALFKALQKHLLTAEAWMLEVDHDHCEGSTAAGIALSTLRARERQGLRVSKYYTLNQLFGSGARSRPSLDRLGKWGVHAEALRMLDRATAMLQENHPGKKFRILSSDRGYPSVRHMNGWAFDLETPSGVSRAELVDIVMRAGATGVGTYDTFVHADVDPRSRFTRWDSTSGGEPALNRAAQRYWNRY